MSKIKQHYVIFLLLFLAIIIGMISSYYVNSKIDKLYQEQFLKESFTIKKQIHSLIKAKKRSTMAFTIALADGLKFDELVNVDSLNVNRAQDKLRNLSQKLRQNSDFKNVWIQLIDNKGNSIARTWSDKKGDSLLDVRQDIKLLIKKPQILQSISTGRYTISFKSIVPMYDQQMNLKGFVESITHFNSIETKLKNINYDSIIVVDKKYKKQLSKSITKLFIQDYYVANFNPSNIATSILAKSPIQSFIVPFDYKIVDNFFISNYQIKSINKQLMGTLLVFKNVNDFKFDSVDKFVSAIKKVIFTIIIIVIIFLLITYVRKQAIDKQTRYFRQIIDTSSNIILVTNTKKVVLANQAFLSFFSKYKTLEEFTQEKGCICNLFIKEEGFLQKQMGEFSWIEYLIKHFDSPHKVKISYKNTIVIFAIATKKMEGEQLNLFTIVLNDITQLETYKNKLEHLSRTDRLTQIGNRLHFDESIVAEFERAKRYHKPLSLLMIDIDYFKKVNDNFGHDLGDEILSLLSFSVQKQLRLTDIFCRYGGEEFMVIMPENSLLEAKLSAERIRLHIENYIFPTIEKITISLGVTEIQSEDSPASFIKRVDSALYESKNNGRNKFTAL